MEGVKNVRCEGKLLGGIKNMYVDSLVCVRVIGVMSERFMISIGVRQGCIMSLCLFNVYMDAVREEVKMGMGRRGVWFMEEGREWRIPGPLYADDWVLCGELEEDLRVMVGRFVEVCKRRGLKVNVGKSKMMVISEEEGLKCKIHLGGALLEHISEFKYLGCVLDEAGTYKEECRRKVSSGRRMAGAIKSLVNARDLQIECDRVLHETLLVPVLTYDSEIMLWKERERSRIRAVQKDILRGLLGIRRMDRVLNARIKEVCGVKKSQD